MNVFAVCMYVCVLLVFAFKWRMIFVAARLNIREPTLHSLVNGVVIHDCTHMPREPKGIIMRHRCASLLARMAFVYAACFKRAFVFIQ